MHALIAGLALFAPLSHADLVATVREALRVDAPAWPSTVLTGKASYYSEQHTFSIQFQPNGKYVQSIKGPLGESYGYDGIDYWEADRSGAPHILHFEDVDLQQAFILVQSDAWLNPPPGVTVTSGSDSIRIKLPSGLEETLTIDPETHLPTQATYTASPGPITIKLSDWRPAGALKIPFKTEITMGGLTDTFIGEEAKQGAAISYTLPKWTPKDISFDPAIPALLESQKLRSGHIIVHPLVNGKDVGWFILDSGADIMVIDPKVADGLKLPKVGLIPLVGVGGVIQEPFRTIKELKLGPATLRDTQCAELDLSVFKQAFGIEVAGIVGFDLFRRSIISVDIDKPAISLYTPDSFKLPTGSWTNTRFSTGNIAMQAKMEGDRVGWYRIDTGANGTVQFHAPYVQKEHLLEGRDTVEAQEAGAGGTSMARFGKIEWFELGGHRFENPNAIFSEATIGAFNDHYLAGNIGQEFLAPFVVYFDFGGSRIALVPKASQ